MDRHVLGMVSSDQPLLKSVFIEENSMTSLSEEDYKDIVKYILTDRTVLVVEPTVSQWNKFATSLADAYITMVQNDEVPDYAIETGELFMRNLVHNVRNNIEDDILGLPIAKTQQLGENEAFASLLYLRGNTVRSYDNASENLTRTVSSESYTYDSNGTLVSSVTDNEPQTYMLNASYTDYYIGKMADDIVPYCYRNDCTFNQSFIYSIPNPTSSRYSLDVYTKQELVAYEGKNTWFYMTDIYHTYQRDTKYKVVLNPPVRFKQDWYMTVQVPQGISQESVRSFLTSHYPKYWKDTFTCYTFTKDDTQPVLGIINDFKNDINNDLASWRNAGFTGTYTISIHPSNSSTVLKTIEFTVE